MCGHRRGHHGRALVRHRGRAPLQGGRGIAGADDRREGGAAAGRSGSNGLRDGRGAGDGGPAPAAETNEVVVARSAAATLHHDIEKVRSWGITVVEDREAEKLRRRRRYAHLVLQDIEADRLERIVEGFGVAFEFDAVAVCVQDHGVPRRNVAPGFPASDL